MAPSHIPIAAGVELSRSTGVQLCEVAKEARNQEVVCRHISEVWALGKRLAKHGLKEEDEQIPIIAQCCVDSSRWDLIGGRRQKWSADPPRKQPRELNIGALNSRPL